MKLKSGVNYDSEAVLSRALSEASKHGTEPGVWEVWEWEDLLYRIHRLHTLDKRMEVRVEVIR